MVMFILTIILFYYINNQNKQCLPEKLYGRSLKMTEFNGTAIKAIVSQTVWKNKRIWSFYYILSKRCEYATPKQIEEMILKGKIFYSVHWVSNDDFSSLTNHQVEIDSTKFYLDQN